MNEKVSKLDNRNQKLSHEQYISIYKYTKHNQNHSKLIFMFVIEKLSIIFHLNFHSNDEDLSGWCLVKCYFITLYTSYTCELRSLNAIS